MGLSEEELGFCSSVAEEEEEEEEEEVEYWRARERENRRCVWGVRLVVVVTRGLNWSASC